MAWTRMEILSKISCLKLCPKTQRDVISYNSIHYVNKKHLKNVGPFRYCEPPLHCQSPGVASRTPAIAIAQAGGRCPRRQQQQQQRQRVTEGTAMAPWPHGMGPITL